MINRGQRRDNFLSDVSGAESVSNWQAKCPGEFSSSSTCRAHRNRSQSLFWNNCTDLFEPSTASRLWHRLGMHLLSTPLTALVEVFATGTVETGRGNEVPSRQARLI